MEPPPPDLTRCFRRVMGWAAGAGRGQARVGASPTAVPSRLE